MPMPTLDPSDPARSMSDFESFARALMAKNCALSKEARVASRIADLLRDDQVELAVAELYAD